MWERLAPHPGLLLSPSPTEGGLVFGPRGGLARVCSAGPSKMNCSLANSHSGLSSGLWV